MFDDDTENEFNDTETIIDRRRVIFYGISKVEDTFNIILTGVTALCP